jgi:hypothetical protein
MHFFAVVADPAGRNGALSSASQVLTDRIRKGTMPAQTKGPLKHSLGAPAGLHGEEEEILVD